MKITKVRKTTDYRHLNMFEITYLDMRGQERKWFIASRESEPRCVTKNYKNADAVVIVPYHRKKEKLVLIKEFRIPLGDYQIGFPAGLVDDGETIEDTVKRELKEETGLTMTKILKGSPPVYSSAGLTDESIMMVFIECDGEPSNHHNESSEDISVMFVTPSEAAEFCYSETLKIDAKAWIVLSTFAANGKI